MAKAGFAKCILKQLGKEKEALARQLIDKYDKRVEQFMKQGTSLEDAEYRAEQLFQKDQTEFYRRKAKEQQQLIKQEAIKQEVAKSKRPIRKTVKDLYQRGAYRGQRIADTTWSMLDEDSAKRFKPFFLGTKSDPDFTRNVTRAVMGEQVADPEAVKAATAWRKMLDYQHQRGLAAGMDIGYIKNYFPVMHTKKFIEKAGKEPWMAEMVQRADWSDMINNRTGVNFASEAEFRADFLEPMHKKAMSVKPSVNTGPSVVSIHEHSRSIKWKSADDWLAYNDKYGSGPEGLFMLFKDYIDGMSKDIGVAETLTSKPTAVKNMLNEEMKKAKVTNFNINRRNAEFNVLTGNFAPGDPDHWTFKLLSTAQNWVRGMLGGAGISSLTDVVNTTTAARMNGLPAVRAAKNWTKGLIGTTDEKTLRQMALIGHARMNDIMDDVRSSLDEVASLSGQSIVDRAHRGSKNIANLTMKASGLNRVTERAGKGGMMQTAAQELGGFIHDQVPWGKLNSRLKESLGKFGISSDDWGKLLKRSQDLLELDGTEALSPHALRMGVFDSIDEQMDIVRIADNIDDWMAMLVAQATTEPGLAVRAITTGAVFGDRAGGPGTISRAAASSFSMFRTFPMQNFFNHIMAMVEDSFNGRIPTALERAAMLALGGMTMGAVVYQIKQLAYGKTMKDWNDPKLWIAGLVQSGGFGLIADFLFGNRSRFGRSLPAEMSGPFIGVLSDAYDVADEFRRFALEDDSKLSHELFQFARKNMFPMVGSLFYTRLFLERMFLDQIEKVVNKDFHKNVRRRSKLMDREGGQSYWWEPGEFTP